MRARALTGLLKAGDRVAVSNITGREASKVTVVSQHYSPAVVGGWALGKGGMSIEAGSHGIEVFPTFERMTEELPKNRLPNKIVVYSPPEAVYGEIKEIVTHGRDFVDTIFVITEHVSVEVTSKIKHLSEEEEIDVIGCNTLGMINTFDHIRVGAVGGNDPEESFRPGSALVVSNSGNMVNTIASYLLSVGLGTGFGVSTGKDILILTPLKEFLRLARNDPRIRIVVLYVEPGGLYEQDAIRYLRHTRYPKPIVVYVGGQIAEKTGLSLGHAGAVIEGKMTSATAKMQAFDEYFGIEPFDPNRRYGKGGELVDGLRRGLRATALHHIPPAAQLVMDRLGIKRDFPPVGTMDLNPWFVNLRDLAKHLPRNLILHPGTIPQPYARQVEQQSGPKLGRAPARRDMRNASHASSNDGKTTRIYGHSLLELMRKSSFGEALVLQWTGEPAAHAFEGKLVEMSLIACLTNGPGTISAQGAKLSTSAGNSPNTAMIASLATIGDIHGGNGKLAVKYLLKIFGELDLEDPYEPADTIDPEAVAMDAAVKFKRYKDSAKEADVEYKRIPCLGHPVFRTEEVNYDPREQVIAAYMKEKRIRNVFIEFYRHLAQKLRDVGATPRVFAVNLDAALAGIWLAICWPHLRGKRMSLERAMNIPFVAFALGRAGGAAGEYLDHQDCGQPMDMRIPVSECIALTPPKGE